MKRPICKLCKKNPCGLRFTKNGQKFYKSICDGCRRHPYRQHKKDRCNYCGFIPLHSCQLDVDHIDGNHKNNDSVNLQTLCANCHRLKSQMERCK